MRKTARMNYGAWNDSITHIHYYSTCNTNTNVISHTDLLSDCSLLPPHQDQDQHHYHHH